MFGDIRLYVARSYTSFPDTRQYLLSDINHTMSNNLPLGLPLFLLLYTFISNSLLPTPCSSHRITCPCYFNLHFRTFFEISPLSLPPYSSISCPVKLCGTQNGMDLMTSFPKSSWHWGWLFEFESGAVIARTQRHTDRHRANNPPQPAGWYKVNLQSQYTTFHSLCSQWWLQKNAAPWRQVWITIFWQTGWESN